MTVYFCEINTLYENISGKWWRSSVCCQFYTSFLGSILIMNSDLDPVILQKHGYAFLLLLFIFLFYSINAGSPVHVQMQAVARTMHAQKNATKNVGNVKRWWRSYCQPVDTKLRCIVAKMQLHFHAKRNVKEQWNVDIVVAKSVLTIVVAVPSSSQRRFLFVGMRWV
jgi:hypothetical protein